LILKLGPFVQESALEQLLPSDGILAGDKGMEGGGEVVKIEGGGVHPGTHPSFFSKGNTYIVMYHQ
jgi:hypothetical protein